MKNTFWLLCLSIFIPIAAVAQTGEAAHVELRKSLVYIEVTGQNSKGQPLSSSGTGVMLDKIGNILTAFHLIEDVEKEALDGEFEISVRIGERSAQKRIATVVQKYKDRDVLVIRVPSAITDYYPACFGSDRPETPKLHELFFTSGFPLDVPYFTGSGRVTTFDGPKGLFGIDIEISLGQSGSPIYDDDGRVLGLIMGSIEGKGIAGQHYYQPLKHIWNIVSNYIEKGPCWIKKVPETKPLIDVVKELETANLFAEFLSTSTVYTNKVSYSRGSDSVRSQIKYSLIGASRSNPVTCKSSGAFNQEVNIVCELPRTILDQRTPLVLFFSLPKVKFTEAPNTLGTFIFSCIRPNCISLSVRQHTQATMNHLVTLIDPIFQKEFVKTVQRLRTFRPLSAD